MENRYLALALFATFCLSSDIHAQEQKFSPVQVPVYKQSKSITWQELKSNSNKVLDINEKDGSVIVPLDVKTVKRNPNITSQEVATDSLLPKSKALADIKGIKNNSNKTSESIKELKQELSNLYDKKQDKDFLQDPFKEGNSLKVSQPQISKNATLHPLQELINYSVMNNPKVKAEIQRFIAARERHSQARRGFLPDVRGDASYGVQRSKRGNLPVEQYPEKGYNLTLTQDLYTGGRLSALEEQTQFEVNQASAKLDLLQNQEALRFLNIYILLYNNQESQKLSRKNIRVLKKATEMVSKQIEAGESTKIDLYQAEARLKTEQATLDKLRADYSVLVTRYKNLIGQKPNKILFSPNSYCEVNQDKKTLEQIVMTRNPNILTARYQVNVDDKNTDVAESTLSPTLAFVARKSYLEGQSIFFQDESNTESALLRLNIPIFDKGIAFPRIKEAKALKRASEHELEYQMQNVKEQFEETYNVYHALETSIDAKKEVVKATEKLFNMTFAEQKFGFKSVYELLEIERDLVSARFDLVNTQSEYVFNACRLIFLKGQLKSNAVEL